MKKALIPVMLACAACLHSQQSRDEAISALQEWYFDEGARKPVYREIEDCLSINTVEETEDTYELFSEDFFDATRTSDVYCAEVTIDGLRNPAFAALLHEGSGRFPRFLLFTYNDATARYGLSFSGDYDMYPIIIDGACYFVEVSRDYDSGRYYEFRIVEITGDLTKRQLFAFHKRYDYPLDDDISLYISSDEINRIAEQDYSFLGVQDRKPVAIDMNIAGYSLRARIRYTSVGYFATTMDLTLATPTGNTLSYDRIWGFKTAKQGDRLYLIILSMDEAHPVSSIESFNLRVIDAETGSVVANRYIEPREAFY